METCSRYFAELWAAGKRDLDIAQLDDWEQQVDRVLNTGARPRQRRALPDHGQDAAPALDDETLLPTPDTPRDGWPAESAQTFVKFFGEGSNRAPWSHPVIEEVARSGCHWACTYPSTKRPRSVADGDTLFVGRLVKDPNDTLIFGRAIGRAHVPGRDEATAEEITERRWKQKWGNYVRVHHAEFVAGGLQNGVSLNELMQTWGSDSFRSTQHNARSGNGRNVNPRRAFMQQPAVELSDEAAAWLTSRLEAAFVVHGRLPADELERLDWPAET